LVKNPFYSLFFAGFLLLQTTKSPRPLLGGSGDLETIFLKRTRHHRAEGHQGQLCQLEALAAKGDAHNGDAKNTTGEKRLESQRDPADQQPENIEKKGTDPAAVNHLFAKGKEGKAGKLETLKANGDPKDGDAPQHTRKGPTQSHPQATENKPDEIPQQAHLFLLPFLPFSRISALHMI
jgi:hypothetical protein